ARAKAAAPHRGLGRVRRPGARGGGGRFRGAAPRGGLVTRGPVRGQGARGDPRERRAPPAGPGSAGQPIRSRTGTTTQAQPSPSHSGAASPAAAQPAQPLTPIRATAFGPNGGDNPQLAHLVLGIRHASGWHTDWYTSARFGNLYPGTGLLLAMGQRVAISSARINLGNTTGASFQLRVGARPALADLPAVARATGVGGVVRLHLARPARGRYVLLWFTRLPTDSAGTFRAHIYDVSLQGHR